ncbi:MAG: three-Cys-motif partner protein TcmP [Nitrososphaerota archaeon]|nr:three-Cys-motif partner protein TcmP [Nitrososphaerota archaeon]
MTVRKATEDANVPKRKKDDYQRLTDQIRVLSDQTGKSILATLEANGLCASEVDNEYLAHTMLKLAYLNYYIGIFARIASSRKTRGGFTQVLFIDAFGGSGLVRIKGTDHVVLGSSLLASLNDKFDKIISFEIEPPKADILKRRLDILAPGKAHVITGDVNDKIADEVRKHVTARTIVLFFVDPEGMEPDYSQLSHLMRTTEYVDTMMNFSWGVYRLDGRIRKSSNLSDVEKMRKFLPTYEPGKTPDESLIAMFEDVFGKPYGDRVDIRSRGNNKVYSMILRIRKTKGNTEFITPIREFGRIIDKYDGDNVYSVLETIKGKQGSLH